MTQNNPEQCQEALWNHWNSGGAFPNAPPLLAAREPLAQAKRWADPGRFLFLSPSATMLSCKVIQKTQQSKLISVLFFVFQSASFFQIFSTSLQIRSFSLPHLFSVSWISSPSPLLRAALLADGGSVAGQERRCWPMVDPWPGRNGAAS